MLLSLIQQAVIDNLEIFERMKLYEADCDFMPGELPELDYFRNLLDAIPKRDRMKIILMDDADNTITITKDRIDKKAFLIFETDILSDAEVHMKLTIDKSIREHRFTVYSYDHFFQDILSLSITDVMSAFSALLTGAGGYLIFDIYGLHDSFTTDTMFFVPYGEEVIRPDFCRSERIMRCEALSLSKILFTTELLPEDFHMRSSCENRPLDSLFKRITSILSYSLIISSASFDRENLKGIMKGHAAMDITYSIKEIHENAVLYKIYEWIYAKENNVDKAAISQNILCKYTDLTRINDDVMAIILMKYELHLKTDEQQHEALKRSMSDFMRETVFKTDEHITYMLKQLKINMIVISGLIFFILMMNIFLDQPSGHLFIKSMILLLQFLVVCSCVHHIVSTSLTRHGLNKVYEKYDQLTIHESIMLSEEGKDVFRDDDIIHKLKVSTEKTEKLCSYIWLLFLFCIYMSAEIIARQIFLSQ